jgi:hypothetical protein
LHDSVTDIIKNAGKKGAPSFVRFSKAAMLFMLLHAKLYKNFPINLGEVTWKMRRAAFSVAM